MPKTPCPKCKKLFAANFIRHQPLGLCRPCDMSAREDGRIRRSILIAKSFPIKTELEILNEYDPENRHTFRDSMKEVKVILQRVIIESK